VALIRGSVVALALEYMAKVAPAVRADNFGSCHAQSAILVASDCPGDTVEISGPAAAGLELMSGLVQRRIAAGTIIDALLCEMLVIFASKGSLGTLFPQDPELLCVHP